MYFQNLAGNFIKILIFLLCICLFSCTDNNLERYKYKHIENCLLNSKSLEQKLSHVRGEKQKKGRWPRKILFKYQKNDELYKKEFIIKKKPRRIIAHSIGVTEILWAIVPRKRLIGFHKICTKPSFCIFAEQIQKKVNIFSQADTEKVISWRPDIVFATSYSSPSFKEKLKKANIQVIDLGFFHNITNIKEQILFVGKCVGCENNAKKLVKIIDNYSVKLRKKISVKNVKILAYTPFGSVYGNESTFDSLCHITGFINVGSKAGINKFKKVEAEWFVNRDIDIIIYSYPSVKQKLISHPILKELMVVKKRNLIYMEPKYLGSISQYIIAASNRLAQKIHILKNEKENF